MLSKITTALFLATVALATGISVTPHAQYSSSIGVLGCYINTNRVAYWPAQPGCETLCKKVSYNGRSVHLLHIDSSAGAYDISYDAWNYLSTGQSAITHPTSGGGIAAEYEDAKMHECADLVTAPDGKLPLMAANSMNIYSACEGTWLHENSTLYNIQNAACTLGFKDEVCTLQGANPQAACKHQLGAQNPLDMGDRKVFDIEYPSGKKVPAL